MCHGKDISIGKAKNGLTTTICRPMHRTFGVKIYVVCFWPHNVCKIRPNIFLSIMPPKCQKSYNVNYLVFHTGTLQLWFPAWVSQVHLPYYVKDCQHVPQSTRILNYCPSNLENIECPFNIFLCSFLHLGKMLLVLVLGFMYGLHKIPRGYIPSPNK